MTSHGTFFVQAPSDTPSSPGSGSSGAINGGGFKVAKHSYRVLRAMGDRIRGLPVFIERQRLMRKSPTAAEKKIWMALKGKQIDGLKFRRQHGVGLYIVDFYCDQCKLIIEVDGSVHDTFEAKKYDHERTLYLQSAGYSILRFQNSDVMNNFESVLEKIRIELQSQFPSIYGGARGGLV